MQLDDPSSLDGDNSLPLSEILPDLCAESPESVVMRSDCQRIVRRVVSRLPLKQAKVLRKRFGIADGIDRTLEQVAAEWGLTRERIRQIEAKALKRLARGIIAPELRAFTDRAPAISSAEAESSEPTESMTSTVKSARAASPTHKGRAGVVHKPVRTSGHRGLRG
jgi:hypothetical protein